MKTILFTLLLTSVCFAEDLITTDEYKWVLHPKTIQYAGESGQICEVYGHQWETITPDFYPAIYGYEPPVMRRCKICGKTQEQKMEWVNVETPAPPVWEDENTVPFEYGGQP